MLIVYPMQKPTDDDLRQYIDVIFSRYDNDKNNSLEHPQLKEILTDAYLQLGATHDATEADVTKFMGSLDTNNDGMVTKVELFELLKKILAQKT